MVAKFLDLNKPWFCKYSRTKNEKIVMYDFPMHNCTKQQNGSPCFFFHFWDNANGRLCKERLLRSRNFSTMVTWRQSCPLYFRRFVWFPVLLHCIPNRLDRSVRTDWRLRSSTVFYAATFSVVFNRRKRPHEAVRGTLHEVLTSDCWKILRLFFGGITNLSWMCCVKCLVY